MFQLRICRTQTFTSYSELKTRPSSPHFASFFRAVQGAVDVAPLNPQVEFRPGFVSFCLFVFCLFNTDATHFLVDLFYAAASAETGLEGGKK